MLASRTFAVGLLAALLVKAPLAHAERGGAPRPHTSAQTAAAQPVAPISASGDDPARIAHAKALFEKAANSYAAGHYYDAIESFLEVDRFYPNDQLPFNVAKAYDNLGNKPDALRYYREYLRRSPDAQDHDVVVNRVRELETSLSDRGIQQITVFSDPPEATLLLDDRPVGLTPWTGETWPGKHRLVARKLGFQDKELVMELEPLKAQEVNLELAREAPPVPAPAPVSVSTERPWPLTRRMSVLTWTTLGVGTAALGTAVAIEASAGAKGPGIAPATGFFAGIGTAAALVGGVMLYFDLSDKSGGEPRAALTGGPGRIGATYQTKF